ncbi:MAG TPA: 16S rRNA (cytidine(1402)-2'-O)-methyltransferase [Candidatus Binatia bacterium]|jgi:16S rRNA (cytidine1402-2'-O)-methyltransferase|nr:16S rRNA (cytidine(1402)-2'-O)-methyltransferase [Candidatus Binatia bacterium]
MAGVLYVVATPIGNLEDITLRALRILKEVDLIAAEDTRHTKGLLSHYGITTPLTSCHEHNERAKAHALVERLERGNKIALVSDAGTPTVSDPGYLLVREAIKAGIQIIPIPGASALTAVLSASGLAANAFVFEGFPPPKRQERKAWLRELESESRTIVFYEAPHRLKESLQDLFEILGDRELVLAREVTKVHEEFIRGRLSQVMAEIDRRDVRGEVVLMVSGAEKQQHPPRDRLIAEIQKLKTKGIRIKEIAQVLGEKYAYSKREIYRLALESGKKGAIS